MVFNKFSRINMLYWHSFNSIINGVCILFYKFSLLMILRVSIEMRNIILILVFFMVRKFQINCLYKLLLLKFFFFYYFQIFANDRSIAKISLKKFLKQTIEIFILFQKLLLYFQYIVYRPHKYKYIFYNLKNKTFLFYMKDSNLKNSFNETNSNYGNPASLKGKLQSLQQQIKNISNDLNNHKKEVQVLRSQKDTLQSVLTMKTADVKKTLTNQLLRIQQEMKRHFNFQKAQNSRIQQQITALKGEKTALQQQLLGLQRRITQLQMQVGSQQHN